MNFARTALRTACVQAPKLARTNMTTAAVRQSNLFNSSIAAITTANFRMYSTAPETASQELAKCLESEIKHEEETFDAEEIQSVLEGFPFQMEHKIGDREVRFTRTMGDEKIVINFMIDEHTQEEEDMEAFREEGMDELDQEEPMLVIPFSVVISKPSKPELGAMVFSMTSDDTGIEPQLIWHSTDAADIESTLPTCYPGPKLTDLDQKLEDSLIGYLKTRGIDNSLGEIINDVYQDKEQREYVNWLNKLEGFVSK